MQNLFNVVVFLFIFQFAHSQNNSTFYMEAGGGGVLYSINGDRRFSESTPFGYRMGASIFKLDGDWISSFPLQINYLLGNKHGLEVGAGGTLFYEYDDKSRALSPLITLAYRYQGDGGFNFRLSANSFLINFEDVGYFWPGISLGWRLK